MWKSDNSKRFDGLIVDLYGTKIFNLAKTLGTTTPLSFPEPIVSVSRLGCLRMLAHNHETEAGTCFFVGRQ